MQRQLSRAVEIARSEGMLVLGKKLARRGRRVVEGRLFPIRFEQRENYHLAVEELRAQVSKMRAMPRDVTITTTTYGLVEQLGFSGQFLAKDAGWGHLSSSPEQGVGHSRTAT